MLKLVVSGCLIGYLLHKIGIQKIVEQLRLMEIYWLIGALVLFTASHFLGSIQWRLLLRSEGIRISWAKTLSFYFVGLFFNNFLISNLGGDIFRMMDVRRYSNNGTTAVSTVFFDRFAGLFVLSSMAIFAAPWVLLRGETHSVLRLSLLALILGWVFLLFFLFNKGFVRLFVWLLGWAIPKTLTHKVREVYGQIHNFGRNKNLLIRILGLSFVVQSARIFTHYLLGHSLGVTISPIFFFLFIPIVAIMASLPISLGGLGLREQTGIVLFGLVGISALQAFSIEFAAYLVAIASSIPGGIVFIGRKKGESDHAQSDLKYKMRNRKFLVEQERSS